MLGEEISEAVIFTCTPYAIAILPKLAGLAHLWTGLGRARGRESAADACLAHIWTGLGRARGRVPAADAGLALSVGGETGLGGKLARGAELVAHGDRSLPCTRDGKLARGAGLALIVGGEASLVRPPSRGAQIPADSIWSCRVRGPSTRRAPRVRARTCLSPQQKQQQGQQERMRDRDGDRDHPRSPEKRAEKHICLLFVLLVVLIVVLHQSSE